MVSTNINLQEYSVPEIKYSHLQIENEYVYDLRARWDVVKPSLTAVLAQADMELIMHMVDSKNQAESVLYKLGDLLILGVLDKQTASWNITGKDRAEIEGYIDLLKILLPPAPDSLDGKVKIRFWYITQHGPKMVRRAIAVPDWNSIRKNYSDQTLQGLEYLMKEFKPSGGGQLIIMHGVPGTGKSYSLRALLDSWKDWCTAEYVLDPESLFSGNSGYLADLVLRDSIDEYDLENPEEDDGKWKLLILEDSGELLTQDSALRNGQGLARLLNLVDGLIGQGLRVLVLITTNEEIQKLHPAVSREGRCAAVIKFASFTRSQAEKWAEDQSVTLPAAGTEFTLSDLYAIGRNKEQEIDTTKFDSTVEKDFGFRLR